MSGPKKPLGDYTLEEIYLAAVKSETEANKFYSELAMQVKNPLLKARLSRLAQDENKHASLLIQMFLKDFPGKDLNVQAESPIPLPEMKDPETNDVREVIKSAIQAEWTAMEFYGSFSELVKGDDVKAMTLELFYTMELGHMRLLEIELDYMADKSDRMYNEAMGYIDEIIDEASKGEKDGGDAR